MDRDRHLDAGNTALITDTGSDAPADWRPDNLRIVEIAVNFGLEPFDQGLGIAEFYRRLAESDVIPTTAQPSAAELEAEFRAALDDFENAIVLHISGKLSGTVTAAHEAARAIGAERLAVFDCSTVSVGLILLVKRVQQRLERGATFGEIEAFIAHYNGGQHTVFTLDTLEFLRRGGRIGKAQALAGSLLKVRPILEVADGEISPVGRVRGEGKLFAAIRDYVEDNSEPSRPLRVVYAHAQRPEAIDDLRLAVESARPAAVTEGIVEIGPVIGTHGGPGTLGAAFFHDPLDT